MVSLLDTAVERFRRAWQRRGAGSADGAALKVEPDLPDDDLDRVRRHVVSCLAPGADGVTKRARAAQLGEAYLGWSYVGRERFLTMLAEVFGSDDAGVESAIAQFQSASDPVEREQQRIALWDALRPPAVELLTLINSLEQGTKFVVDLRADLRRIRSRSPALSGLDASVARLLVGWFDVGFLELRAVTWDSPAALLEKLIQYEAVHEIQGWDDLRNRLAEDRRTFAYFHPQMPDEPLIFVEVALVNGIADDLTVLLDPDAPLTSPGDADTAIFYSISNCQEGLAGIPLGDFLIKRVVARLRHDLPDIRTFATLSPLSGFRSWLTALIDEKAAIDPELAAVGRVLADDGDGELESQRERLLRLCARYLTTVDPDTGTVTDRVEHFHLTNGARVERINWMANSGPVGIERGFGMMVNYRYELRHIDDNREAYVADARVVYSGEVAALL